MRTVGLVVTWLTAITAANLITANFGPAASVYTSFALVALTLVTRDALHDLWKTGRLWKMGLLIAGGGAVAYIATPAAGQIALASCIAFATSETVDGLVYHGVRHWAWLERSNLSNLFAAAVDSIVFPTIAFGSLLVNITVGQFTAKVAGALLFTLLIQRACRPGRVVEAAS